MTVVDSPTDSVKFGVGARISDTLSIFGSQFATIASIAVVLGVLSIVPAYFLVPVAISSSATEAAGDEAIFQAFTTIPVLATVAVVLVPLLVYVIMSAMIVMAAYDARNGSPMRVSSYATTALRRIVPLTLVTIVVGIAVMIGFVALVVPGLWAVGVFSAVIPLVMIENAGFGAIGRSAALTKEYRWPIVGFTCVMYILTSVISAAVELAMTAVPPLVSLFVTGAVTGVTTALLCIASVVVYVRLREIKEGGGFADFANVFS